MSKEKKHLLSSTSDNLMKVGGVANTCSGRFVARTGTTLDRNFWRHMPATENELRLETLRMSGQKVLVRERKVLVHRK